MDDGGCNNRFGTGYSSDIYDNGGQQQRPSTSSTPPMMECGADDPVHQLGIKPTMSLGTDMCNNEPSDHHESADDNSLPSSVENESLSNGNTIKKEYTENKQRRYKTFSERKTSILKKAYELSTFKGTQVMLLVVSETGNISTFVTHKLQPMITSEASKALIRTCLNSPDLDQTSSGANSGDQRISATEFEKTGLSYNICDHQDSKLPLLEHKGVDKSKPEESLWFSQKYIFVGLGLIVGITLAYARFKQSLKSPQVF